MLNLKRVSNRDVLILITLQYKGGLSYLINPAVVSHYSASSATAAVARVCQYSIFPYLLSFDFAPWLQGCVLSALSLTLSSLDSLESCCFFAYTIKNPAYQSYKK